MAEWSKAPVLKTGDVKASVGSNPTLSANFIPSGYVQKYPSGRRGSPAKGVGCVKSAARVQIPPSAPTKYPRRQAGVFCWQLEGFEDELQWPAPKGAGLGSNMPVACCVREWKIPPSDYPHRQVEGRLSKKHRRFRACRREPLQ